MANNEKKPFGVQAIVKDLAKSTASGVQSLAKKTAKGAQNLAKNSSENRKISQAKKAVAKEANAGKIADKKKKKNKKSGLPLNLKFLGGALWQRRALCASVPMPKR